MPGRKYQLHDGKHGVAITIRVTPRAKKNQITEIMSDGTIKIHLTAPPLEGKANAALIEFLADILKVPRKNIEIVAGKRGRNKIVSILDMDPQTIQAHLESHLK